MEKILFFVAFLSLSNIILAKLQKDPVTGRFYSLSSMTEVINQSEYHQLVWTCRDILRSYAREHAALLAAFPGAIRSSNYDPHNIAGKNAVLEYLQRIATPTSLKLLADLKEIDFNI